MWEEHGSNSLRLFRRHRQDDAELAEQPQLESMVLTLCDEVS